MVAFHPPDSPFVIKESSNLNEGLNRLTKTNGLPLVVVDKSLTLVGILSSGDAKTQYIKLQEECGELAKALLSDDDPEIIDAIGDIVVVLTNLSHLKGYKIEDCIDSAYNVISERTGKMINGTFVKDED